MKGEWKALVTLSALTVGAVALTAIVGGRAAKKVNGGQELPARAVGEALGLVVLYAGLLVLAFLGVVRGRFWVLEIPFQLALGWFLYFARVVEAARPNVWAVVSGVVCATGAAVGAHYFLRWLAGAGGCAWPPRRTVQVLALLVVMFAAGLAVTGLVQQTGWLLRTPDPVTKDNRLIE